MLRSDAIMNAHPGGTRVRAFVTLDQRMLVPKGSRGIITHWYADDWTSRKFVVHWRWYCSGFVESYPSGYLRGMIRKASVLEVLADDTGLWDE